MRTAREVNHEVIILGGGPAGIAAAWAAADNGADVLLVERQGFLGGMSTGGLLNVWCGDASCGIYRTIRGQTTEKRARRCVYSPESLKSLYIRELRISFLTRRGTVSWPVTAVFPIKRVARRTG